MNSIHYKSSVDSYAMNMKYIYHSELHQPEFYDTSDEATHDIRQLLTDEQHRYEFPSKSRLKELSFLDEDQTYPFFDSSSLTAYLINTPALVSGQTSDLSFEDDSTTMISSHKSWHETISEEDYNDNQQIVEDSRLSPLQLPAQAEMTFMVHDRQRPRKSSCDSIMTITQSDRPVGPSSFLSKIPNDYEYEQVTRSYLFNQDYHSILFDNIDNEGTLGVFCNEAIPIMNDFDSNTSCSDSFRTTGIVLIKLNKRTGVMRHIIQSNQLSDEGYDDTDEGIELESDCVFYPINNNEDKEILLRDQAAIKIQSLWRGYRTRRNNKGRVLFQLAKVCTRMHRRQMNKATERIYRLEQRVHEETGMRMAFEKAMEDMTVLIDQQQKILYDRIDQEVRMRQTYENKMNVTLQKFQPLESKLRKEAAARNKLEEMMSRVLTELHENELARQQESAEHAEYKKQMQIKLDKALDDISAIKKQRALPEKPSVESRKLNEIQRKLTAKPTKERRPLRTGESMSLKTWDTKKLRTTADLIDRPSVIPSSRSPLARPSVVPSNRRPLPRTTSSQRPVITRK
ncbi:hypothetical protein BDB01DRAFT_852371 [Pilobolus umbonatus]|nr:hypothetical protein BDB01DRAFT_852371 [Pilobolus umbonatus]